MTQQEEYESLQKKHRVLTEERNIYLQKTQELQRECEDVKNSLMNVKDEYDILEKEYKKLSEKHRDTMTNEYNLALSKDHLEASI